MSFIECPEPTCFALEAAETPLGDMRPTMAEGVRACAEFLKSSGVQDRCGRSALLRAELIILCDYLLYNYLYLDYHLR